jgi:hypothetical protein
VGVRLTTINLVTPTPPEHAAHPDLGMIAAMAPWSTIEPSPGVFDWTTMDANVQDATTGGYTILLRIMAGRMSPAWLADEGAATIQVLGTDPSAVDYCDHIRTPVPWDPVLREAYTGLLQELARWLALPDGVGGTNGDHIFAIPVAMPSFQGTEMNLGYGGNVTCPSGTDGAGQNLAATNQQAWSAFGSETDRRSWTEQAWVDAIDLHMQLLPPGTDSILAYGALFGDQQAAALRLARTEVSRYPDRLWSMYTNLQPNIHADGSFGPYREWCPICHQVMMAVTAAHGLLGFQTASIRIVDTDAKFRAAVEDGLSTYGMRFLETQPANIPAEYGYLLTDPGNVQGRIRAVDHARPTTTDVVCGAAVIGGSSTCTATVTDTGEGAPITPGGTGTLTWTAGSGSLGVSSCTPVPTSTGGAATCAVTYTPGAAGPDTVAATYAGDANHQGAGGSADLEVGLRPTSSTVTCGTGSVVGVAVSCTASITDTGGGSPTTPAGDLSWSADVGPGATDAQSCTLVGTGAATASCSVSFVPGSVGGHTVTAGFAGDALHASITGTATFTSSSRASATTVSCASPIALGSTTTCTATVTDTSGGTATTPTGTVSWRSSAAGSFTPTSCTLAGAGSASTCAVTYRPSVAGAHAVTATFAGDPVHAGSASAPSSVTVTDTAGPTLTITAPSGTTVAKNKTVSVAVAATDPSGVASVRVAVGSTTLCTDTTSPYACSWKVPAKANVTYTITATGTDKLGNVAVVTKTVRSI